MQSVSSRIWTRVAVSISYDYNHYTTVTFTFIVSYLNPSRWVQIICIRQGDLVKNQEADEILQKP